LAEYWTQTEKNGEIQIM